jgi:uncharacterized protein YbcI
MLPQITSELTKTQIKISADLYVKDLLETGDVIKVAEYISSMEYFLKEFKASKDYIDAVRTEIEKHKTINTNNGSKLELTESGVKYDYSKCDDPILADLMTKKDELDKSIEERQKFLKSLSYEGMELVLGDEVVKLFPPSKSSTSTYKVTLKK